MRRNVAACIADVTPLYSNTACPALTSYTRLLRYPLSTDAFQLLPRKGSMSANASAISTAVLLRGGFFLLKQPRNSSYKFVAAYF